MGAATRHAGATSGDSSRQCSIQNRASRLLMDQAEKTRRHHHEERIAAEVRCLKGKAGVFVSSDCLTLSSFGSRSPGNRPQRVRICSRRWRRTRTESARGRHRRRTAGARRGRSSHQTHDAESATLSVMAESAGQGVQPSRSGRMRGDAAITPLP